MHCAVSPRLNFDCVVSDVEIYSLSKRGKSCTQLPVRDANPNLVLSLLLLLYKMLVVVANILIPRPLLKIRLLMAPLAVDSNREKMQRFLVL